MIDTVVLIPVRGIRPTKTRMASLFSDEERMRLTWAMLRHLVAETLATPAVGAVLIVTQDPAAVASELGESGRVIVLRQHIDEGGLNAALNEGAAWARNRGVRRLLMLPGDLPCVTARDISAILRSRAAAVLISDCDRDGTNALALRLEPQGPAAGFRFEMGPGSFDRHFTALSRLGIVPKVASIPGIERDLDDPRDWASLPSGIKHDLLDAMAVFSSDDDRSYMDWTNA